MNDLSPGAIRPWSYKAVIEIVVGSAAVSRLRGKQARTPIHYGSIGPWSNTVVEQSPLGWASNIREGESREPRLPRTSWDICEHSGSHCGSSFHTFRPIYVWSTAEPGKRAWVTYSLFHGEISRPSIGRRSVNGTATSRLFHPRIPHQSEHRRAPPSPPPRCRPTLAVCGDVRPKSTFGVTSEQPNFSRVQTGSDVGGKDEAFGKPMKEHIP